MEGSQWEKKNQCDTFFQVTLGQVGNFPQKNTETSSQTIFFSLFHSSLLFLLSTSSARPSEGRIIVGRERQLHFNCPGRGHRPGRGPVGEEGHERGNARKLESAFFSKPEGWESVRVKRSGQLTPHLQSGPTRRGGREKSTLALIRECEEWAAALRGLKKQKNNNPE